MVKWLEHPTCSRKVRGSTLGWVIPKTLKMEPAVIVLGAQHKQWKRESKLVSHNWKKIRGRPDLQQLVTNWAVKSHLTDRPTANYLPN